MFEKRRLTAIMFTDMVGFSRITNTDPLLARELNEEHQNTVRKYLKIYNGSERQTTGDGFFIEFQSAFDAMTCAIEIQQVFHDRNRTRSGSKKIQIRIGLHSGEVIEKSGEIFGDTVNIAARLEPLAPVEGICVSRSFYDLVSTNWKPSQFSSQGKFQLKNIKGQFELFHFNFQWTERKNKKMISTAKQFLSQLTFEQLSLGSLFIFGFIFLASILFQTFVSEYKNKSSSFRKPASSIAASQPVLLNQGWKYTLSAPDWTDYDMSKAWKYADIIKGEYQLQNEFEIQTEFTEPALVLGLIPDTHRVFLNGQFIGGSNRQNDLGTYTFDPHLLKKSPEKNNLLVKAVTRSNFHSGLTSVTSNLVPQLGEFGQIKKISDQYFFKAYILKNIYFVFSLIIFILSISFAIFLKNRNDIFYSSLYLLFGCMHYSYYNPLVVSAFDDRFLMFLKLGCIVLSSIILYSGYLATRQKTKLYILNNVLSLVTGLVVYSVINFYSFESSVQFIAFYNLALALTFIYILVVGTGSFLNEILHFKNKTQKGPTSESYFFLLFSFLSLTQLLGAFQNGAFEILFNATTKSVLQDIGISLSFVFAVSRIILTIYEFTQNKRLNMLNKMKDEFFIELSQIISSHEKIAAKIDRITKLSQNLLKAEKTTLYFVDPNDANNLKLFSNIKDGSSTEKSKSISDGVFGYVLANKQALLIENINEDYRFQVESNQKINDFKTGACMIFPLLCEDQIVGVLTFADKENAAQFTSQDLEVGLKISSFISLLSLSSDHIKNVA